MAEARVFQALSDPTRLKILAFLAKGPRNVSRIVGHVKAAQPAVSRHLRVLKEVTLIRGTRNGKEVEYALNPGRLIEVGHYLTELSERVAAAAHDVAAHEPGASRPSEQGVPERHKAAVARLGARLRGTGFEPDRSGAGAGSEVRGGAGEHEVPGPNGAKPEQEPAAKAAEEMTSTEPGPEAGTEGSSTGTETGLKAASGVRQTDRKVRKSKPRTGSKTGPRPVRVRVKRKDVAGRAEARKQQPKKRKVTAAEETREFVVEHRNDTMDDFLL